MTRCCTANRNLRRNPDDSAFNGNATQGYFLLSDTGGNTVYKITSTGLSPNMTFVDMGNEFEWVDLRASDANKHQNGADHNRVPDAACHSSGFDLINAVAPVQLKMMVLESPQMGK